MRKFLIKTIFLLSVFLIPFNANSDEYFCLDKDGLVYPVFDDVNCEKSTDEYISKKEFINIVNFDPIIRNTQLSEFRKKGENQEIITEKDINIADAIKIKNDSLKKIKTTKDKQKKSLEILKSKKQKKKQKYQRLAKIKNQKKLILLKKKKRLAKLEKQRNEKILKNEAKKKRKKQEREAQKKIQKKKK